jgi:hypothetical protein
MENESYTIAIPVSKAAGLTHTHARNSLFFCAMKIEILKIVTEIS